MPPPTVPPLADSIAAQLTGTWKLIEIRDRDASGVEQPALRGAAGGQLLYAANGRLSVQIIRTGREHLPAGSSTGFSSYFGTWKLMPLEGYVMHQQDGSLNPTQTGQAAKRYYSFDSAGHLALATPPAKREDGRMLSTVFVCERLP